MLKQMLMNDYWAKYTNVLNPSASKCYNKKVEHGDGFSKLPDLYFKTAGPIKARNVQPRVCGKARPAMV